MQTRIVSPDADSLRSYLLKVFHYRSLIISLAVRDIKIQYAQTMIGILWAAIQPLTGLLIFTFFFGRIIQVDTGNLPYPLFAFSGMTSWYFFSAIIYRGGTSLVNSQELIKKVYFPKLVLPLSKVIVSLIELIISFVILLIMMLLLGELPDWQIIFLPAVIALNIIVALSVAIWLAALTITYRDFNHIIPYLVNFGIWLTPVFYPSTILPSQFDYLLHFNPMAGVIAGFRWCLVGGSFNISEYSYALLVSFILLLLGIKYFINAERKIPDLI